MESALRRHGQRLSGFVVRRVAPAEWEQLRTLRIEALTLHPEAFSRDFDAECALTGEQWRERIARGIWFCCLDGAEWAGIAGLRRDEGAKTAHLASFGAMYVRAPYRGRGVGDALIEAAVAEAVANRMAFLELAVNADNRPAIALYERHGFRPYGRKPNALFVGGRFFDEIEMMRTV